MIVPPELEHRRLGLPRTDHPWVVLDDERARRGRELHHAAAAIRREGAPARVLEGRDRVQEGRVGVLGERLLQLAGDEAVLVHRDGDGRLAGFVENLQRAVVGRQLDEHRLPAPEVLSEQHEPLKRAVGQEHAVRRHLEPLGDRLAERRVAGAGAVGADRVTVAVEDGARAVGALRPGGACGRGHATRTNETIGSTARI
jgi:hypothetical protein